MSTSQKRSFVINKKKMLLNIDDGVFVPTATTESLINAVKKFVTKPGITLDLGSGSGVVGISLFTDGLVLSKLYASDLSKNAIKCIENNCARYDVMVDARQGSLFEPWRENKFDYIVDDISGVSEGIAKISPWFNNVSCSSGKDGIDLTDQVLKNAKKYLNQSGRLFFPVISLSNVDDILNIARDTFDNVKLLSKEEWPLPKEMYQHTGLLQSMKNDNRIQYDDKFGMIICYTYVYVAYD